MNNCRPNYTRTQRSYQDRVNCQSKAVNDRILEMWRADNIVKHKQYYVATKLTVTSRKVGSHQHSKIVDETETWKDVQIKPELSMSDQDKLYMDYIYNKSTEIYSLTCLLITANTRYTSLHIMTDFHTAIRVQLVTFTSKQQWLQTSD